MKKTITQVVVGLPVPGPFDYVVPEELRDTIVPGQRVYVSFGGRRTVGYVTGLLAKSAFPRLKSLLALLDNAPALDGEALQLTKEFSEYYGCSWGEAIETSLPAALRRKKFLELAPPRETGESPAGDAGAPEIAFCHDKGLTGRWPFLREEIAQVLGRDMGVLVLVPEAHQAAEAKGHLEKIPGAIITILDRALSPSEELARWIAVREGRARLAVGTRSAVFAPVRRLGLIVMIDEDHHAYKQEQSPFYHAREVARFRARRTGCRLLFAGSVPSAELWQDLKTEKAAIRAIEPERLSPLQVIDLANYKPQKWSLISFPLQNNIQETLARGGKILLFLNRRGFSSLTRCNQCGHTLQCERCRVNLSYLYSAKTLVCHRCGGRSAMPAFCPQCKSSYLRSTGGGIEKVESELARNYPQARLAKFDKETAATPSTADIIVATQAVLRVLDRLTVALVGILDIDAELNRLDFRAGQRAFSLMVRLRQAACEKVVVQTHNRDSYCLKAARDMDFEKFYQEELKLRRELSLPPFRHLAAVGLRGRDENAVFEQARVLYEHIKKHDAQNIEVLNPQPDFIPKLRDQYRFSIMLKGKSVPRLLAAVSSVSRDFKKKKGIIVTVNVDP